LTQRERNEHLAGQGLPPVDDTQLLDQTHRDVNSVRKETSTVYQLKRANTQLERQIEQFRNRERELLEAEDALAGQLVCDFIKCVF